MTKPPAQIKHIRIIDSPDGEMLIAAVPKKIKITPHILNGVIPGYLVEYGPKVGDGTAGRTYHIPHTNVMRAEVGFPSDEDEKPKKKPEAPEKK